jgi:hypothetical protein
MRRAPTSRASTFTPAPQACFYRATVLPAAPLPAPPRTVVLPLRAIKMLFDTTQACYPRTFCTPSAQVSVVRHRAGRCPRRAMGWTSFARARYGTTRAIPLLGPRASASQAGARRAVRSLLVGSSSSRCCTRPLCPRAGCAVPGNAKKEKDRYGGSGYISQRPDRNDILSYFLCELQYDCHLSSTRTTVLCLDVPRSTIPSTTTQRCYARRSNSVTPSRTVPCVRTGAHPCKKKKVKARRTLAMARSNSSSAK